MAALSSLVKAGQRAVGDPRRDRPRAAHGPQRPPLHVRRAPEPRPADGQGLLANAGHPYPLLLEEGGCREITGSGLPLGQGPKRTYDGRRRVELPKGGVLVFASDGLYEGPDLVDAPYGYDRPRDVLDGRRASGAGPPSRSSRRSSRTGGGTSARARRRTTRRSSSSNGRCSDGPSSRPPSPARRRSRRRCPRRGGRASRGRTRRGARRRGRAFRPGATSARPRRRSRRRPPSSRPRPLPAFPGGNANAKTIFGRPAPAGFHVLPSVVARERPRAVRADEDAARGLDGYGLEFLLREGPLLLGPRGSGVRALPEAFLFRGGVDGGRALWVHRDARDDRLREAALRLRERRAAVGALPDAALRVERPAAGVDDASGSTDRGRARSRSSSSRPA